MANRWYRVVVTAVAATALVGGCSGGGGSNASSPSTTTTAVVVDGVASRVQTFTDSARSRTLPTTIMTPVDQTSALPLVVFLHGYDQTPADYTRLLRAWVKAGYVVAAPAFPKTRHGAVGGLDSSDYRNEPGDVAFVITELVAEATGTGPLARRMDPARIAVAGHSLGAEVVLGLLNTCCRESRAIAAISLAGSEQFNPGQPAFPLGGYFAGIRVPILLVHGDADTDNPYSRSRDAFNQASAPKFLETIVGGDHRIPYQGDPATQPAARAVITVTTDFLDAYVKGQAEAATRLRADGTQTGVAKLEAVAS